MDIAGIESIVDRAERVFAPIVPDLLRAYERGPAAKPHQLPELLVAVKENLTRLRTGSVEVDVINVMELERVTALFERWRLEPNSERLLRECRDRGTFVHNRMLLAVASLMADAPSPLGFEFIPPAEDSRSDFALRISVRQFVEGDVKTPEPLQRVPNRAIPAKDAAKLIHDVVKKSRGQVADDQPSILVIGGAFWSNEMDEHAESCCCTVRAEPEKEPSGHHPGLDDN